MSEVIRPEREGRPRRFERTGVRIALSMIGVVCFLGWLWWFEMMGWEIFAYYHKYAFPLLIVGPLIAFMVCYGVAWRILRCEHPVITLVAALSISPIAASLLLFTLRVSYLYDVEPESRATIPGQPEKDTKMVIPENMEKFDGSIEYRNSSKEEIYVSELTGFEYSASCGYLVAGATDVGLELGPTRYPSHSKIKWKIGQGPEKSQILDFGALPKPFPKSKIVIEYTAQRLWKAFFEPH